MVLIHILSKDPEQIKEIANHLVKEKLILNALITDTTALVSLGNDGTPKSERYTLLMGKTKALLFNTINKKLLENYPDAMPVLYSVPIVNMDWDQADRLRQDTIQV